ncbi:hypothetical protein Sgleb_63960 [Streptomyces glebosus]|uniref:Glycosyltransferase n=1 Tax=Streptomyces glebosus TaxID=249580 RepID=A0A640T3R3_9ACTN|nr:hypothetical protein Sgleb_63960 [Streptomyces glebosus]GHG58233.1 hypothetical protein GCM10010513_22190 [Streptomyces glebosus]
MSARLPATLLVIAKEPVPGRVKTRLTPPYTPQEAAALAEAALADTLHTVLKVPVRRRVLVLDGVPGPCCRPASTSWPRAPAAWTSGSRPPSATVTADRPS